jgi:signal transduction histidine kinase
VIARWAPRTLRARLSLGHALIVFISIAAFAFAARQSIGTMQRTTSDRRQVSAVAALRLLVVTGDPAADLRALASDDLSGAIFNRDGRVVTASAPVPPAVAALAQRAAPDPTSVVKLETPKTKYRVVVTRLAGRAAGDTGALWRIVDTMADADNVASLMFAAAIPLIVVFALVAGDLWTRRSIAMLETIAVTARAIEASDLSRRIEPVPRTRELADLCLTLNRMFARLEAAFERQRRLTADVSHELRTPLSVIMAEADLGAGGLATPDEYEQAMSVILREAHAIESLTSDLLVLAREDHLAERRTAVELSSVAARAVERLKTLARARNMNVRSDFSARSLVLGEPLALARIPISLLHNALKFADEGATIDVRVEGVDAPEGRTVRLVIEDDGPGFSTDGLTRALDRGWRGESRPREGSGLGLAIVAMLVASAQGTIEIANRSPHGARVAVTFPAAQAAKAPSAASAAS